MKDFWLVCSVPVIRAVPSDPEWEYCFGNNPANHPGHPPDWRNLHVLHKVSDLHSSVSAVQTLQHCFPNVLHISSWWPVHWNRMWLHFVLHSICRLEWKPHFWKSLSHTHSYSPITVESDFNNPLYEAGVSTRRITPNIINYTWFSLSSDWMTILYIFYKCPLVTLLGKDHTSIQPNNVSSEYILKPFHFNIKVGPLFLSP